MNQLSRYSIVLIASLAAHTGFAATSTVKAPPLPSGSEKVKLQPGQDPKEIARDMHAHQRPKKDKSLDDTRTTTPTTTGTATTTVTPTK